MFDINPSVLVIIIVAVVSSLIRRNGAKMRKRLAEQEQLRARQAAVQTAQVQFVPPPSVAPTGFPGAETSFGEGMYTIHSDEMYPDYGDDEYPGHQGEGAPREYIPDAFITPHDTHEGEAYDGIGHFVHEQPARLALADNDEHYNIQDAMPMQKRFTPEQMRQGIIMKEILTRKVWTPGR